MYAIENVGYQMSPKFPNVRISLQHLPKVKEIDSKTTNTNGNDREESTMGESPDDPQKEPTKEILANEPASRKEHTVVEVNISDEECHIRTPVLTKTLCPVLATMTFFGIFFRIDKDKAIRWRIAQIYVVLVNLLLIGNLVVSVCGIAMADKMEEYLILSTYILTKLKCVVQGLIVLRLCHNGRLWSFIKKLEVYLEDIKMDGCSRAENKFSRSCKLWAVILFLFVTVSLSISIIMTMYTSDKELMKITEILSEPFEDTPKSRYIRIIADVYMTCSWFFPMILCVVLTQSLSYTFQEFYRYMESKTTNSKLCLATYVRTVRVNFIKLTTLCGEFDEMFNTLMMVSYLIDIILICLICRLLLYNYVVLISRLFLVSWLSMPLISLAVLSKHASNLYEMGQEMSKYIQNMAVYNVCSDAKVELDLLLFHVTQEPVVMTIWKMIPLNRSIIVSIFVSILTYLTMLLSFL